MPIEISTDMSSLTAPRTPAEKAASVINRQLATPPTTGHHQKIAVLNSDARYFSIHTRRRNSKFAQLVKQPFAPLEAAVVAVHPCYRGEKHDGNYYHWLLDLYDGDLPDIVRRINKFRGFPQNDDPTWNTVNADEWREKYNSEEYQAEMRRYIPYLETYWNDCGDNFDEHVETLDDYYQCSDKEFGRKSTLEGDHDEQINGDCAERANTLCTPPSISSEDLWEIEMRDHRHDIMRSFEAGRFGDFEDEKDPLSPTRATLSPYGHIDEHIGEPARLGSVSGHFISQDGRGDATPSPGLLWINRYTKRTTPRTSTGGLLSSQRTSDYSLSHTVWPPASGNLIDSSSRFTSIPSSPPSVYQYHSPAGDIFSPEFPKTSDWAELNLRADHQALAVANGFVPSPRNGIEGRQYSSLPVEPLFADGGAFPMGALRHDPNYKSPFTNKEAVETINPEIPVDFPSIHNNKSPATPHSRAVNTTGISRKRAASSAISTLKSRAAKQSRVSSAQRGYKRRGHSGKGRKNHESDEDYTPDAFRVDDKDVKFERLPSKLREPSARRSRQTRKVKAATSAQAKISANGSQTIRQEDVHEHATPGSSQVPAPTFVVEHVTGRENPKDIRMEGADDDSSLTNADGLLSRQLTSELDRPSSAQ